MAKTKNAPRKPPRWLDQSPTVVMRRELENAVTHFCHLKRLKPAELTRDSIAFPDLLPYLKAEHDRWDDVEPGAFSTNRPKCIKGLHDHFHHFRRNDQDLAERMELNKDRFTLKNPKLGSSSDSDDEEEQYQPPAADGRAPRNAQKPDKAGEGEQVKSAGGGAQLAQRQQQDDADEEVKGGTDAAHHDSRMLAKRPAEAELTDLERQFWLRVGKSAKVVERARAQYHEEPDALASMLRGATWRWAGSPNGSASRRRSTSSRRPRPRRQTSERAEARPPYSRMITAPSTNKKTE